MEAFWKRKKIYKFNKFLFFKLFFLLIINEIVAPERKPAREKPNFINSFGKDGAKRKNSFGERNKNASVKIIGKKRQIKLFILLRVILPFEKKVLK